MEFKEKKAIYLQIADLICDDILQGKYQEGDRIPSVREYAAAMEVNSNTCVRAFDWLQLQDVIFTKRGLGYFVGEGAREKILGVRKENFFKEFIPELIRQMKTIGVTKEELLDVLGSM